MQKKLIVSALSLALLLGASPSANADENITRVSGANRYATSMKSQEYQNSKTLVFASGELAQDSLSAINICTAFNAKLVLVNGSEDMSSFVKDGEFEKVYIVGGINTIPEAFENSIKSTEIPVERIAGDNRFDTNEETLEKAEYKNVALANSDDYSIALSATRFYKEKNLGLLLANTTNYNEVVDEDFNVEYVLGNSERMPYDKGTRVSGPNKFETSVKIADMVSEPTSIALVSGDSFADALSAINVSLGTNSDIFVVPNEEIKDFNGLNDDLKKKNIYILGGEKTLPEDKVNYTLTGELPAIPEPEAKYEIIAKKDNLGLVKMPDGKYFIKNLKTGNNVNYDTVKNGIFKLDYNHAYMLNQDNTIRFGEFNKDGKTYLATPQEGLRRGWKYMNDSLYYFSPSDYAMYKDGIKSTGKGVYWFGKDGKLRTGRRPGGHRGKRIMWYGPTKAELDNHELNVKDAQSIFKGQEVINYATKFDGLPFKWYGCDLESGQGVYCCGAAYSAYKHFGIKIPGPNDCNPRLDHGYRMVKVQYLDAPKFGGMYIPTNWRQMHPADISYSRDRPGHYSHAALYMGMNGNRPMVVHATLADGFIAEPASIMGAWGYQLMNSIRYIK